MPARNLDRETRASSSATSCGPTSSAAPRPRSSGRSSGASSKSCASAFCRSARRAARQDAGGVRGAARACASGVTMTTTLLAKDTSHRTVFAVFTAGGGMGVPEMDGAGNFVMVRRSRDIPRAAMGRQLPAGCSATSIFRTAGRCRSRPARSTAMRWRKLAKQGFDYLAGLEVEFQLFKLIDPKLGAGRIDLAARGAGGRAHHARLPVSDRAALRPGRADPRYVAPDRAGARACRCARSRSSSARASTNSPSRRKSDWLRPTPWCCSAAP